MYNDKIYNYKMRSSKEETTKILYITLFIVIVLAIIKVLLYYLWTYRKYKNVRRKMVKTIDSIDKELDTIFIKKD